MTIKQRLMALIVASTLLIVGVLTWFFTSQQIGVMEDDLRGKATTYAQLAGKQVMSAIAFSDRETAREVLAAIATDTDVASVTLTGDGDEVLFASGKRSWKAGPVERARVATTATRVVSVTPVTSLEGPKGTLVIELSKQQLIAARARLLWIGVITGIIALLGAAIMAWLIAGGLARRLRAIGKVATAVANGDLEQQPVDDPRSDEVGLLARAFNTMLAQLRQLFGHLEALVAERTAALEARNVEMRHVFDQVEQGLLVVDLDGTIAPEHSAAVGAWLGAVPPSRQIVDFIRGFAADRADWFAVMWDSLKEDLLPLDLAVTQLPDHFDVAGRHLTWSYKPFATAQGAQRILIVVSDVTAQLARERDERDERETTSLLTRALRDRDGFVEAYNETARLVAAIERDREDMTVFAREVHTLKGVAGLLQLTSIATPCHALETAMTDEDREGIAAQRAAIAQRWAQLADKAAPYIDGDRGRLAVYTTDVIHLETAIARGASAGELLRLVAGWRDERATDRFQRIAEQARSLALRLGKGPLDVAIECDPDLRFPAELSALWSAFAHGVRNSIDHGIEDPEARTAAGKAAQPTLGLRAAIQGEDLVIELADDGRGIDWDRVGEVARMRGLPAETPADLEAALFHDGLSTRADVTETSGRGIGMAALRAAAHEIGAGLTLSSGRGRGTTLRIVWPRTSPAFSQARAS